MKNQLSLKHSLLRNAGALILLLLPIGASAFDLSPNVSRVISDPSYLPLQGQIFGTTEYSYGNTSFNTNNYLNTLASSNNTISNTITQTLAYAFTDDFTLRVSDSLEWPASTTTDASGNVTTTNSSGFTDPSIGATWRVFDEQAHLINWDLIGSYSPNFINAQSATPANNGNAASGGDTATFGTALSYKGQDFTLYLLGRTTYLDNRNVLNPTSQITTTYNSSWQYYFEISTQTRFTDRWSVNLALSETFDDNINASYVNAGGNQMAYTLVPGTVTELLGALNFQAIPDRLVISAVYNHNFYNIGSVTYSATPASDTTTFNKGEDVFSGELRYVFN